MTVRKDNMIQIGNIPQSGLEETFELQKMASEAEAFLLSQDWCKSILNGYLDRGWAGILAVFYFEIIPTTINADNNVWIIVGDLPPAYIDTKSCPNGATAIDGYVGAMW